MALVLGLFVYLTFNDDWTAAALNANKLRVEKELVTWTERHTQLLTPRTPLYTDRRTARILNFLGGSNIPLGALDTYPFHWELSGEKLLKPVPPNFSLGVSSAPSHVVPTKADMEGGFWAINPRVVKWLAQPPRLAHVGLDVYAADIPETWCFLSVLGGETATPGALFEIPSRVTAKRQTHDLPLDIVAGLRDGTWHIFPTTETITPTENGFGVTLERDQSIRLMSEPLDRHSGQFQLSREVFLKLRMQAAFGNEGGWSFKVFETEVKKGKRLAFYRERKGNTSPSVLALDIPPTAERLVFELTLNGPGSFEWQRPLAWPRVELGACN